MATTSKGLRYPVAGDNPAVHTDFLNLAGDIDTLLDSYVGTTALVNLVFEGSTADAFETTLTVVDPTADRTITFPDATGTVTLLTATQTLTNKTLGNALAAGGYKITGLANASQATDTDAVNVLSAQDYSRTVGLMLGGM
jgi:hypothetical protein